MRFEDFAVTVKLFAMLEDRDYMRQPEYRDAGWRPAFRFRWSWTVALIAAYAVVFLAELAAQKFFPHNQFFQGHFTFNKNGVEIIPGWLPLSLEGIARGYAWQFVTYQFLHAGWMHLLLNCWAIYTFGRELEELLGARRFLTLMFTSGILGGVFQVLVALLWPQYFGGPVVGASACAFGLVAAFALLFPERELTMLIFFVIPIHTRAKTLLIASAVLAVMGIVFPWDNVANAAHLGGMAMGWIFVRKVLSGNLSRFAGNFSAEENPQLFRRDDGPAEEKPRADFMASEVDPILDKISAHGIQSLTAREREILDAARKQMEQR
jgi:membrane associated rhomboid family serine protease